PVALLIFEQFDAFDQARLALRAPSCVQYGKETGPVSIPPYGAHRFVRLCVATLKAADVYSPLQEGWVAPRGFQNGDIPIWAPANRQGPADAKASFHGEQIRAELSARNPQQLALDRAVDT